MGSITPALPQNVAPELTGRQHALCCQRNTDPSFPCNGRFV
jgi:hypothetical protein